MPANITDLNYVWEKIRSMAPTFSDCESSMRLNSFLTVPEQWGHSAIIPDYLEFLKSQFGHLDAGTLHVVLDCGNGAASLVAQEALEQLGCKVTGLYCELDGQFPNHHPDPTVVENLEDLRARVLQLGADVGIAYDGDADRIGVIDEKGNILWGDRFATFICS